MSTPPPSSWSLLSMGISRAGVEGSGGVKLSVCGEPDVMAGVEGMQGEASQVRYQAGLASCIPPSHASTPHRSQFCCCCPLSGTHAMPAMEIIAMQNKVTVMDHEKGTRTVTQEQDPMQV